MGWSAGFKKEVMDINGRYNKSSLKGEGEREFVVRGNMEA